MEILRDAGSIPAASTDAGVTTRLKIKQARQLILASQPIGKQLPGVSSLPDGNRWTTQLPTTVSQSPVVP